MAVSNAMNRRDRRSSSWRVTQGLWGAIPVGLAIGAVVATESLITRRLEIPPSREIPFLLTMVLLLGLAMTWLVVVSRDRLFSRRFGIAIVVLLVAGAASGVNVGRLDPTDLAIVVVFVFWLFAFLVEQQPVRIPMPVLAFVLLLLACSFLSVVNGGFGSLFGQRTIINKCLVLVMMATMTATAARYRLATRALFVIGVISALIALGSGLAHMLGGVTFTTEGLDAFRYKSTPFGHLLRVTGLTPTTQTLAHLLVLSLSAALFVPMPRLLRVVSVLAMVAAMAWTFSIGGYVVAFVIFVLALLIWRPHRTVHYVTYLGIALLLLYLSGVAQSLYERMFLPLGEKGVQDRIIYLRTGVQAIERHPLMGIGLRNIGRLQGTPVHNAYVQFAAEVGLLGGALFAALVSYLVLGAAVVVKTLPRGPERAWMSALLLGVIGLALHLAFEPFFDNYMTWAYLGIVAGAIAHHDHLRRIRPGAGPRRDRDLEDPIMRMPVETWRRPSAKRVVPGRPSEYA